MHFIPAYMDKLSKGQLTFVKKRTQKYSKQTQYYVHTFNPKAGHSLPFFVKFPKVSEYFEQIPRNHMWNQHRQGLYNGMFFVPAGVDDKKEHFTIPQVIFGDQNINEMFKQSDEYKLLQQFGECYRKLQFDVHHDVHLMNEDFDYTKLQSIIDAGILHFIIHANNPKSKQFT